MMIAEKLFLAVASVVVRQLPIKLNIVVSSEIPPVAINYLVSLDRVVEEWY